LLAKQIAPGLAGFVHEQAVPLSEWVINHNLGRYPVAVVLDSGGTTVEGTIIHTDANSLTITFSGIFSGVARLI